MGNRPAAAYQADHARVTAHGRRADVTRGSTQSQTTRNRSSDGDKRKPAVPAPMLPAGRSGATTARASPVRASWQAVLATNEFPAAVPGLAPAARDYSCPRIRRWLRRDEIRAVAPQRSDQIARHRGRPLKFDEDAYRQGGLCTADRRTRLTFDFHRRKAVVADFDGGLISSDAGLPSRGMVNRGRSNQPR